LQATQFAPTRQHHLTQLLQPGFQFTENLFGIAIRPVLNRGRVLAGAIDQGLALLLGLLPELHRFGLNPFGLLLAGLLLALAFQSDRLQISQTLLASPLMLIRELSLQIHGFLLQLLPASGELLLHLIEAGLQVLVSLGYLPAGLLQQLFAVLTGLLPDLGSLTIRFLPDRGGGEELLPLLGGLGHDLAGLLAGLLDLLLPVAEKGVGLGDLGRKGFPKGIQHVLGVLLVDQTSAREGDPTAIEEHLLELVQLFKHGEWTLGHLKGRR
jgi:hypothetical protein